jgi:hypothetical protein
MFMFMGSTWTSAPEFLLTGYGLDNLKDNLKHFSVNLWYLQHEHSESGPTRVDAVRSGRKMSGPAYLPDLLKHLETQLPVLHLEREYTPHMRPRTDPVSGQTLLGEVAMKDWEKKALFRRAISPSASLRIARRSGSPFQRGFSSASQASHRMRTLRLDNQKPRSRYSLPREPAACLGRSPCWLPSTECAHLGHQRLQSASVAVHKPGRQPGTISFCHSAPAFHNRCA